MKSKKERVLDFLKQHPNTPYSAKETARELELDRTNSSRYLNQLVKEKQIGKTTGRPVLYTYKQKTTAEKEQESAAFSKVIGYDLSLKMMIQQAKAAILYPPRGLHTLILGETGTGKSLFAERMHEFAVESGTLPPDAPFVSFNSADYAQNPQLLFGHIFGVKKGSYTGADEDQEGLIKKADGGILFLDEIHRLPPEGQEMLFTFIDKGVYQPLGESEKEYHASVQIIGATTEQSSALLNTFNRRIPMTITLPPLSKRTIEERHQLAVTFLQQEAYRLNQEIQVEREVIIAFMLYQPEGNFGQVERDLKLVCAKAFLHYRTNDEDHLTITQKDLPLPVQKGLLSIKEVSEKLNQLLNPQQKTLLYKPDKNASPYHLKTSSDMSVYNVIEEKVEELLKSGAGTIELEEFVKSGLTDYFNEYVEQLANREIHKELIPNDIWELTEQLYKTAQQRLERTFNSNTRFAFALHLQSTLERLKEGRQVVHPDLNGVRKQYSKEFQTAVELSSMIEKAYEVDFPLDEIGFITMFLTIDVEKSDSESRENIGVLAIMHGKTTASSMMETVQELLDTTAGIALDMPLTKKAKEMYETVRDTISEQKENYPNGFLLLTDMGSLNTFGDMLMEELDLPIKTLSMTSTPVVLEAVRLASMGRPLDAVYQNCIRTLTNGIQQTAIDNEEKEQAVVVACFTGEGVARQLEDKLKTVIDTNQTSILSMQYLKRKKFRQSIDQLMIRYDIKAIIGTVPFDYANIPYYPAIDIFDNKKVTDLKQRLEPEVPIDQIAASLEDTLREIDSVKDLLTTANDLVKHLLNELNVKLDASIRVGILMHLAFLVDSIKLNDPARSFPNFQNFYQLYRLELDTARATFLPLEEKYTVSFSDDDLAYIVSMVIENR
ncbi:MAG: sigma 54-interacting transcriptional regulator [Pisciglobus halotolerans]|nr:sigma 54-interacting transcriptional regulator [Pisciglobus halotolerans]